MGYNLPEGNNSFLDNDDMICEHCEHKDDVSNGEYVDHRWYCNSCYKELFKVCPKCNICKISVDDEMCEDCLAEKSYDESALGMFEKLNFEKTILTELKNSVVITHKVTYTEKDQHYPLIISFDVLNESYVMTIGCYIIRKELANAITQQLKEFGWIK